MVKKLTKYLLFLICVLISGVYAVRAAVSVTANGDIVTVKATSPTGIGFWYNTNTSFNTAKSFSTSGVVTSSGEGQVSLKNGNYYFFVKTTAGNTIVYPQSGAYSVTSSCTNDSTKTNMTGTFSVERCYVRTASGTAPDVSGTIATCANGYYLDQSKLAVISNGCKNASLGNLKSRYCKVVISATCSKDGSSSGGESGGSSGDSSGGSSGGSSTKKVAAAKLSSLSVSSGSLSPKFKSGTKKYTVNVESSVSSVNISASVSGGTFVNGYGPRTINLNYGSNTAQLKVKNSAGKVTTYTVYVVRADGRSTVNSLSNMTVTGGELTPAFSSTTRDYVAKVAYEVESVTVDATLTDSKSKFVSGFGPGTYQINPGNNQIYIKIQSEKGEVNVYSINVIKETLPTECTTNTSELALLKGIELSVDTPNVEIEGITDFDKYTKTYSNIQVPYEVTSLTISPLTEDENDMDNIEITGNGDLEVNIAKEITIKVTSKKCPNYSNIYTLNVTRQPVKELSSIVDLDNILIEGHEDFKFQPNETNYNLVLNKGETELGIEIIKKDASTICEVKDNVALKTGSKITIDCTSEDQENVRQYVIKITGVRKGTSVFLIIIIIILIILLLIYLLLRLLGYKIIFNFSVIGDFFRRIGEKIKNIFDK